MSGMAYIDVVFASSQESGARARRPSSSVREHVRPRLPANVRVQVGPAASSTGWVFQYVLVDRSRQGTARGRCDGLQDACSRPALASIPGVAEVASVGARRSAGARRGQAGPAPRARSRLHGRGVRAAPGGARSGGPRAARGVCRWPWRPRTDGSSQPLVGDVARLMITATCRPVSPTSTGLAGGRRHRGRGARRRSGRARRARQAHARRAAPAAAPRSVELVTVYDRLGPGDARRTHAAARAGRRDRGRGAGHPDVPAPRAQRAGAAHDAAAGPAPDLRGHVAPRRARHDHEPGRHRHRARHGGRCRRGGAGGLPPPARDTWASGASAGERRTAIIAAAGSFAPAILTSLVITALSFLPVFAFTGETGRLLRPLAITKTLVIVAAALVALTLAPALRDRLLRGRVVPEFDNPLTRGLVRDLSPVRALRPAAAGADAGHRGAGGHVLRCRSSRRLGGEFLPRIDEGDLLFMPTTLPGVSAGRSRRCSFGRQDRAIASSRRSPRCSARSVARTPPPIPRRTRWPRPPSACGRAPNGPSSRANAGIRAGRRPSLKRVLGLVWPEETPATTAELVEKLDRADAPARLDQRLDRAGARPHGHDGDRRAHAGRHPRRRRRSGAAGCARRPRCSAWRRESPGRAAPSSNRSAASPGRGSTPIRLRSRGTASIRRSSQSTADLLLTGGQVGELESEGRALPRPRRPIGRMDMSHAGAVDQLRDVTVRSGDGSGQPVPLALLGRPSFVDDARDDPHRARRARRLRLRRPERGHGPSELRAAARSASWTRRSPGASCGSSPASGSSGPASTSSWPRASGA